MFREVWQTGMPHALTMEPVKMLPSAARDFADVIQLRTTRWEVVLVSRVGLTVSPDPYRRESKKGRGRGRRSHDEGSRGRSSMSRGMWVPLEAARGEDMGCPLEPPPENSGPPTPCSRPVRLLLDF